ncbi:MAG: peptide deformylase [Patescibacteria group bacterium]|jgi:peptide deformylase|nr:peptide deformylase [Patescibacteria group bacterium]
MFDESLTHLVEDLIETMKSDIICIGLAAPQVGISLQVAVVCPDRDFSNVKVLINPTNITESGKKDIKRESCMSLPDLGGNVERRKRLSVDVRTLAGETATLQFEGFEARAVAHELDHLSGTMYSDKADALVTLDFDAIRSKLAG